MIRREYGRDGVRDDGERVCPETPRKAQLYAGGTDSYTGNVQKHWRKYAAVCVLGVGLRCASPSALEAAPQASKPEGRPQEAKSSEAKPKEEEKAPLPFQIAVLETHVRFEANGDSRKQVHTIVKINDPGGARQFSRLGFDYNRAFQQVEIPLVKISHANGGTSEVLPSAITDMPNPAVEKFPAYQDVRVKSVRILGLQEGDTLEYRVITTTSKPPLAPDFWLEHKFDRSGQVVEENYELDIPKPKEVRTQFAQDLPHSVSTEANYEHYTWHITSEKAASGKSEQAPANKPDIVLSTFLSWSQLSAKISHCMQTDSPGWGGDGPFPIAEQRMSDSFPASAYRLISSRVATVDLPVVFSTCPNRTSKDAFLAGYGTPEEKARMLSDVLRPTAENTGGWSGNLLLYTTVAAPAEELPRPSLFDGILLLVAKNQERYFLDPSIDVAPFGMIRASVRGRAALDVSACQSDLAACWIKIPDVLPFAAKQNVSITSEILPDGKLTAKVKYLMRGDNELVLRMAFHQTPKERWNEVAGLLALSDGFRGHIESVKPSDPMETKDPFTVEYEITQPKFVDWSKKPVRIPALLPQIALPDAPGNAAEKIELGTPLDVETSLTLRLPAGTTLQTPPATSVSRDYATYASKYDGHLNTLTASRHVRFLLREIPGDRAADYNAFTRAVQLDQAQAIGLFPPEQSEKK